jgi:hypothetical protein
VFGERCGKYAGVHVVVVVDLGSGLAGVSAEDSAGALHKATFEGDRRSEEQRSTKLRLGLDV